ncbi:MAG TPA: LysR family transcriptional regulator [Gemmatimonadaceae bacterium]|nr:LysR family transcriptional regulator [Gemmatimonadaceae bacterium]
MSELDLRQLRYFVVVAEEGTIGRAAHKLGVAQPAISRQLKLLERAIGTELLSRHAKGCAPTSAGEALLSATRGILAQIDGAVIRAARAAQGRGGSIRFGVGRGSLASPLVQRGLALIRQHFPDIDLTVEDLEAGPSQWRGLLGHTLDLALGVEPPPALEDIATERITDARIEIALVSTTHPLASRSLIEAHELNPYPILWVPRAYHPDVYDALTEHLERLGNTSPIVDTHSGVYAVFLAVAANQGWQPLPSRFVEMSPDGTVGVPVHGLAVPLWEAVMWRADDERPIIRHIVEVFESVRDDVPLVPPVPVGHTPPRTHGLELRHLRALAALIEEAGWTRGAQRLGVAPSVLFRNIDELERELDLKLFDRLPRGVRPTAAGTSLANDAARVLAALDAAVAEASRIGRLHRRRCVLSGVDIMHASPVMREVLRRCAERYPDIEMVIDELPTPDQFAALLDGRIDLGVGHVHASLPSGVARMRLASYVFDSALLAVNHPLATRATVRLDDLAAVPFLFIRRENEPHFHDAVMHALGRPPVIRSFDSLHTARVLALQGRGWTLGARRHYTGLVAVPIDDVSIPSGLELLFRREEPHPTVRMLLDLAIEVIGERERRPRISGGRPASGGIRPESSGR